MNRDELLVIEKTIELAKLLAELPVEHPDDLREVFAHLHDIQSRVASRSIFRILNDSGMVVR